MTVIAWDGQTLAADRRAVSGHGYYSVTKIARIGKDCLVGVAGRGDRIREFQDWLRNGAKKDDFPKRDNEDDCYVTVLVVRKGDPFPDGGRPILLERYENSPLPILVEDWKHAIGCGGIVARAAMMCGKDAHEACNIAINLDENCGNGIQTLTFEEG